MPEIPDRDQFPLTEEESKHIVRVLRMTTGDEFLLLNGVGLLVTVAIVDPHPKKCLVNVLHRSIKERKTPGFHLAIAPTKNMDRMEWMVEKIVEIGATKLSFIQTDRSERINLKLDRLFRVAISAMKQAEHDFLLDIQPVKPFNEFIQEFPSGCIAHCMDGERIALPEASNKQLVLIGPEGDFSPNELTTALKSGYEAIHLGTSRLRTETAGMVAAVLAINTGI
jgi:16S rRNA (uracil1498-N3)-methyltransferase